MAQVISNRTKKWIRTIFIVIIIILLAIAFNNSYRSLNIDNLAFVLALGIDIGTTEALQLSFQFVMPSSSSESDSSAENEVLLVTVEAPSIETGINIMNSYLGKKLNVSHCKLLVFSEELASHGISSEIHTLMNDPQIRPSSNIIVSKCDAKTYISNSKPSLETLPSSYYEIFAQSSYYTGYVANSTIGRFFNGLICNNCSPYAILGGLNSQQDSSFQIEGQRDAENIGLAVFREDKLVGELDAKETLCFSILRDDIESFLLSVPVSNSQQFNSYTDKVTREKSNSTGNKSPSHSGSHGSSNFINSSENSRVQEVALTDIYFEMSSTPKIKVDIVNGSPFITIDCKLDGRIYSTVDNSNYLSTEFLDDLSLRSSQYLENLMYDYLYKTSNELHSDITGIGNHVRKDFLTNFSLKKFNWSEAYANSIFKVNVDANVESSFLLTET